MCIKLITLGSGEACIEANKHRNRLAFDVMILLILTVELYTVPNRRRQNDLDSNLKIDFYNKSERVAIVLLEVIVQLSLCKPSGWVCVW